MRNHYVRAAAASAGGNYVTDNLVFHLDAANTSCYSGSGTTVNSLVNNHTNDHFGDLQWSSDSGGNTGGYFYVDGTQDTSLQFPYSTDFEAFAYAVGSSSVTVTDYSWEWWWYGDAAASTSNNSHELAVYYMLAPTTTDGHAISGSSGLSATNKGNYMFYRLNGNERSYIRDSSNTNVIQEMVTWTGFRWQHYVLTRSGNSTNFYRDNGTPVSNTQASHTKYSNTKKLNILTRYHTAYRMVRRLGVMRFYQGKALTAAEVEQNYDAEKSRYT